MQAALYPDGRLVLGGRSFRAALGRGGIRRDKQEGDGATPVGLLRLIRLLYRADRLRPPATALPREPIASDDGWCDDPAHADYNRAIRLPHPARHEALWREDGVYDLLAVLDWNAGPVRAGRGSAIFLHLARADYAPTEGCVALAEADLRRVLEAGLSAIDVVAG